MYCNKCGNEINSSEKFCSKCGNCIESFVQHQVDSGVQQYNDISMSDKEVKKVTNNMISGYYLGMMILFDIIGTILITFIFTSVGLKLIDVGNEGFVFGSISTMPLILIIYMLFVLIIVAKLLMTKRINKLKNKILADKRECCRKKIIKILVVTGIIYCIFLFSSIILLVSAGVLYLIAAMIILKEFDK